MRGVSAAWLWNATCTSACSPTSTAALASSVRRAMRGPPPNRSTCYPRALAARGREVAGTAALKKFRDGYLPDSGESRGPRVHAVEALHREAKRWWKQILLMRSEPNHLHFVDSGIDRANTLPPQLSQDSLRARVQYLLQACMAPALQDACS